MATGSCTTTIESYSPDKRHAVVKWVWLASDNTGSMATAVSDSSYVTDSNAAKFIHGMRAVFAVTTPGTTKTPLAGHDIEILDSFGCNLFGGALDDLPSVGVRQVHVQDVSGGVFAVGRYVNTGLRLSIGDNAGVNGTGSSGTVRVILMR